MHVSHRSLRARGNFRNILTEQRNVFNVSIKELLKILKAGWNEIIEKSLNNDHSEEFLLFAEKKKINCIERMGITLWECCNDSNVNNDVYPVVFFPSIPRACSLNSGWQRSPSKCNFLYLSYSRYTEILGDLFARVSTLSLSKPCCLNSSLLCISLIFNKNLSPSFPRSLNTERQFITLL